MKIFSINITPPLVVVLKDYLPAFCSLDRLLVKSGSHDDMVRELKTLNFYNYKYDNLFSV